MKFSYDKFISFPTPDQCILTKTIEGYGFCFDFIVKGIIFSTQIINRYVAEPSLCKDSIKFSRCLEALLADLQKHWNTPEIEVPTVAYPILPFLHSYWFIQLQNCFDNRNAGTFMSKMHIGKISEICDFWLKTRFFTKKFFFAENVAF